MTYRFDTKAIHGSGPHPQLNGAINVPIYQTSTFHVDEPGLDHEYVYSRGTNPTRSALQDCLKELEDAAWCLAYSSGMAASVAALSLLRAGDHLLVSDDVYGGTYHFVETLLERAGAEYTFVDVTDVQAVRSAWRSTTRMLWVETPTNPLLKIAPLQELADLAHEHDARLVVDNTFASPYLQRPLHLGADLVVHSTTKYLAGHSDVLGGAALGRDPELAEGFHEHQILTGAIPGPMDCFLTLRGIRTLGVRMDRHCANAAKIAAFLSDHPAVADVYYPGLATHRNHEIAASQMRDYGGMVSFRPVAGAAGARQFVAETKLFTLAVSLGGVESLCEIPALMTHAVVPEGEASADPTVVRLSVGLEDVQDLIDDLQGALARVESSAEVLAS